jgi:hypothetical protein
MKYSVFSEAVIMSTIERLFTLEIEFHRRLRTEAPGTTDVSSLHTSYALQSGYIELIRAVGLVSGKQLKAIQDRQMLSSDARDVIAARDSLKRLLGIRYTDG